MCRAFITVILLVTACSFCCTAQAQQSNFPRLKQHFADSYRKSVFAKEQLANRILVPDTLFDGSQETVLAFLETQYGIRHLFYNSLVIILYSGSMQPAPVEGSQDEIFKVSGHLLDARTGANIVEGTIIVPDANLLINTDPSGYFEFDLPGGRYHIKALGQGTFESNFELVLDRHRLIDIELFEKTVELEEVIVSGTADDVNVVNLQPGSVTLQIDELKRVPGRASWYTISQR